MSRRTLRKTHPTEPRRSTLARRAIRVMRSASTSARRSRRLGQDHWCGLARPMLRGVARLRFKFTLTMAAYDLIGCRTCLARPHDRQKVVQNGIDTDQSGNHELARVQRQFSTRRRHEFQWPARSLIHLNLSSSSAQICNSLAEARTPSPRVSSWQPS